MRKRIFATLFGAVLLTMNPLSAMEKPESDLVVSAQRLWSSFSSSVRSFVVGHECPTCTKWYLDPNNSQANGAFSPVHDDVTLTIVAQLPFDHILLIPLVSKKMCNIVNGSTIWNAMDHLQRVHVSQEPCLKQRCFENIKYYHIHTAGLFVDNDQDTAHSVKGPQGAYPVKAPQEYRVKNLILPTFIKDPCESTWNSSAMRGGGDKGKFYSFSIGQRQFESWVFYEEGKTSKWIEKATNKPDGETVFFSLLGCFLNSCHNPTFLIRELKGDEAPAPDGLSFTGAAFRKIAPLAQLDRALDHESGG